jgi:hypothetical protein
MMQSNQQPSTRQDRPPARTPIPHVAAAVANDLLAQPLPTALRVTALQLRAAVLGGACISTGRRHGA